jgi:hypothetical protein
MCVLLQALIARLHEAEDTLDDEEGMPDFGAHAGLGLILRPLDFVAPVFATVTSLGEIGGLRCVLAMTSLCP